VIKKFNKIKNLGLVFPDYTWDTSIPPFKRYNLIYGWNGSGKTTLTRLFGALESGSSPEAPGLEYECEDTQGNTFRHGSSYNQKIRVFNHDYIEQNIQIRQGKARTITLTLGDVNKQTLEQIETDTKDLEQKKSKIKKQNEELERLKKSKDKIFSDIAKTIYVAISGVATRNYRKDNAEDDFALLPAKEELSEEGLRSKLSEVKQESKSTVEGVSTATVLLDDRRVEISDAVRNLTSNLENVLAQTVESQIITRLKENPDIATWVETGMGIHKSHNSATCEFCNQALPEKRLHELTGHFNDADRKLKQRLDELGEVTSRISGTVRNIIFPDQARLYDELQQGYEAKRTEFDQEKSKLLDGLEEIQQLLNKKRGSTTEALKAKDVLDTTQFIAKMDEIKKIIDTHNTKTSVFETEKKNGVELLKKHYLSTVYDEVKRLESDILMNSESTKVLQDGTDGDITNLGVSQLEKRIFDNQAKISSTHKACQEINIGLATFLGRNELTFEPYMEKVVGEGDQESEIATSYLIKRGSEPATGLSEGEKTAIAFVYFTIHLQDQGFNVANGIVVIDDPVSSLDSNSMYQAFAFLKNSVKDANQVFILTHNFDFLKLVLNWFKRNDRGRDCQYYMIKNRYDDNHRCAYIDIMDKELREYESEYHYLYKLLKLFESDGTIAQSYPIPNIARKVLETFLMFRVPNSDSIYDKLETIRTTTTFDPVKLTAIYKFTNDQSHITGSGFDPALVPETQKNVQYILNMVAEIFPEHAKILEDSIR
jgi:wobble nucleotide-excising tRNase